MRFTLAVLLCASALIPASAFAAEQEFKAKLVSQAILPANTLVKAPDNAPEHLKTSGKFTTADRKRADGLGTVPGKDGARLTNLSVPFDGQPVQGFSGIKAAGDGTYWSLSDNGFGSKLNSPDAMLMLHHLAFDWEKGTVTRKETIFLTDPDKKVPFPIVMEGSDSRYLTGSDLDVESIQPVADGFWIGDEFGPYLVKVTRDGKVTDVVATKVGDKPVRSPDNPAITLPANPTLKNPVFNLKRSGGFEGLAQSKDGSKLYGLLEGPLFGEDGSVEKVDGAPALRIIEFDIASKSWTGRSWLYPLATGGEAIGDFNMIDDTTALVIERDNGAGVASKACADPKAPKPDCFDTPAKLKRIYKIEMTEANAGGAVRKIGYVDLLRIADPDNKARQGGGEGFYDIPFVTIENVDIVDDSHIIVGNDNNLPFSAGRAVDKADDDEFVILEVGDFLKAR
ncbi:esterase-like activity of phytase family protein [Phyllobacterium zundukense]|uniref:Glycerophosphodiester phosphodiesterase n=1 Tax=Phyllobacterium zundukense TaxID=1867719 RepID=A0A2N9VR97_9HYPH|nr:esterase-like activity of phytase family protein [Phyllobacterium zundukense]ATU92444.1 glycerophosphodiester phosphodiesterase [Phyllobacterium zundukense]PIO42015.1 glycerophosphodiester phosphodiesterase [Phyllobacterium zundukense]